MEPQANKKTQEDRKALQTNAVSEFNEYLKRIGVRSLEVTALKDSQWKLSFDKAGKTENLFLAITTPKIENGKIGQVGILISTNEISKENNGISLRELTGSKELREKHSQLIEKINIPELNLIVRNIAKIVGITNLDNLAQASLPKVTNLQILADTINSIPKDTA
ncbi:MAG: hypothetical protein KBC84_09945, partial [Proteobacteria bacterium]|nr:hypothetical protein [Pseudomonadota bacterium]